MANKQDLEELVNDLRLIEELAAWAYHDGYQAEGPRTSRPSGPGRDPNIDVDYVPGARNDIGVGNFKRREAFTKAMTHVARADVILAAELASTAQPELARPDRAATFTEVTNAFRLLRVRVRMISDLPYMARTLRRARVETLLAWQVLSNAFVERNEREKQTGPVCRICKWRERSERKGGRCSTCAGFRTRNGYERPPELDGTDDAHDAKRRRTARGDGYGDESGSCTGAVRMPDPDGSAVKRLR